MTSRDEQKALTRARILDAAVDLLIEIGYAAVSTLAVQRAARVSRGALLHHFPTMHVLTEAMVAHLVERNEAAVRQSLAKLPEALDPVSRAVTALYGALVHPAFQAELELWAAARTDDELRAALRHAERGADRDLYRVVDDAFGEAPRHHPNYRQVADLTVVLLRGLAISRPLHATDASARRVIEDWSALARRLLETPSAASVAAGGRASAPGLLAAAPSPALGKPTKIARS